MNDRGPKRSASQPSRAGGLPAGERLVGRDDELARIAALVESARSGQGQLILIGGEAGIGKTALVRALTGHAQANLFRVRHGHCYDLSQTPPYGPWRDALDRAGSNDERTAELSGTQNALDPPDTSQRIEALFEEVSLAEPLLVIIEDVHWSDEASLMLLRRLAHRIRDRPVLLAATYRDDEVRRDKLLFRLLPRLVREAPSTRFEPRRLNANHLSELVSTRYRLPPPEARQLVTALNRYTDGIPLFVEELLRTFERDGRLTSEDGMWRFPEPHSPRSTLPVPELLRQILEDRLVTLDESERQSLRIAAVIGEEFPFDLWRDVLGAEFENPAAIAERALDKRILEESAGGERLRFRHALVREALYRELAQPRRRDWHRRVADVLLERPDPDPDAASYHLQQAGDPRAAGWLIDAAERALRAFAPLAATERLRAAVELLPPDASRGDELGWYLLRLGSMAREEFSLDITDEYLNQALEIARASGNQVLEVNVTWARGTNRCYQGVNGLGHMQRALELSRGLDTEARTREPLRLLQGDVISSGVFAIWCALFGDWQRSLEAAGEQLSGELPVTFQQQFGAAFAHGGHAYSYSLLGRPDEARREFGELQTIFGTLQHAWAQGLHYFGELVSVALPYFTDDLAYRAWLAERIEALWRDNVASSTLLPPRYGLNPLLLLDGHWDELREMTSQLTRSSVYDLYGLYALGVVARFQGEPELAWRQVQAGIPEGPASAVGTTLRLESLLLVSLAVELSLDAADLDRARTWLAAHDRWFEDRDAGGAMCLWHSDNSLLHARILRHAGDEQSARAHAEQALNRASGPRQPLALLQAHRVLGRLTGDAGNDEEARPHLAESARLAIACNIPHELAQTRLDEARMLARAGERDTAAALLDEAGEIIERMNLALLGPVLAEVHEHISGVHRTETKPSPFTPRELEVLRLLVAGASNREIAAELSLSVRTVERHIANVYNRTGIHGRAAITAHVLRHGWI